MKKRIIKMINNERTSVLVKPSKGCVSHAVDHCYYTDNAQCSLYAQDICEKDYAGCTNHAEDHCSPFGDYLACSGLEANDIL